MRAVFDDEPATNFDAGMAAENDMRAFSDHDMSAARVLLFVLHPEQAVTIAAAQKIFFFTREIGRAALRAFTFFHGHLR